MPYLHPRLTYYRPIKVNKIERNLSTINDNINIKDIYKIGITYETVSRDFKIVQFIKNWYHTLVKYW